MALRHCAAFLLAVVTVSLAGPTLGQQVPDTEKRIALVIANSAYDPSVGRLKNTTSDAKLISGVLRKLGFDVTVQNDMKLVPLRRAVADYTRRLREAGPNTVGFFFYSGHGAAESELGPNYLIPVDANLDADELSTVSEKLEGIIDTLANVSNSVMQFVVFDACRNVLKRGPTRGAIRGFVPVEQRRGMVIVFSTSPKEVALDEYPRGSSYGPFARKFADVLETSVKREDALLTDVQSAVFDYTKGVQSPYVVRTPVREFFFKEGAAQPTESAAASPARPKSSSSALNRLQEVIDSGSLVATEREELSSIVQKIKARSLSTQFRYYASGDLLPGSGNGNPDTSVYASNIVFPIEGEAYANSQIFGYGGGGWSGERALPGSECDPRNYQYPWRDTFCEIRTRVNGACPDGKGTLGVVFRPAQCKDRFSRLLAVEDGVVTKLGSDTVLELTSHDGKRRWTYRHWHPSDMEKSEGSTVRMGEPIGTVSKYMNGTRSTTYHLFIGLEIKDENAWRLVNPYLTLVRAYERHVGIGIMVSD